MGRLTTFMKVLGGVVILGTVIALPFVISDIVKSKRDEGEGAQERNIDITCSREKIPRDFFVDD